MTVPSNRHIKFVLKNACFLLHINPKIVCSVCPAYTKFSRFLPNNILPLLAAGSGDTSLIFLSYFSFSLFVFSCLQQIVILCKQAKWPHVDSLKYQPRTMLKSTNMTWCIEILQIFQMSQGYFKHSVRMKVFILLKILQSLFFHCWQWSSIPISGPLCRS